MWESWYICITFREQVHLTLSMRLSTSFSLQLNQPRFQAAGLIGMVGCTHIALVMRNRLWPARWNRIEWSHEHKSSFHSSPANHEHQVLTGLSFLYCGEKYIYIGMWSLAIQGYFNSIVIIALDLTITSTIPILWFPCEWWVWQINVYEICSLGNCEINCHVPPTRVNPTEHRVHE